MSSSRATWRVNDHEKSLYSRVKLGRNYNSEIVAECLISEDEQGTLLKKKLEVHDLFDIALSTNVHKR